MARVDPRSSVRGVVVHLGFYVIFLLSFFPLLWIVLTAFKPGSDAFAVPPTWVFVPTLENFEQALGAGGTGGAFASYLGNSLLVSVVSTTLTLALGAMAGHTLARKLRGRAGESVPLAFLLAKMIPALVLILPLYLLMQTLGLIDSPAALIIAYTAFNLPFAVWMSRGFFRDVPLEIEEAAYVDGASHWTSFWRVALPLAVPGLAATAILVFMAAWNEFLFAKLLTSQYGRTAPVAASLFITDDAILWGPIAATATLIIGVPLVLTMLLQKYIVRGLAAGALKQ